MSAVFFSQIHQDIVQNIRMTTESRRISCVGHSQLTISELLKPRRDISGFHPVCFMFRNASSPPPLLIIPGREAVTWHSCTQGERVQIKDKKMVGIWARVPLLTSSAGLWALGEALILPVIQLIKVLQATEGAICLSRVGPRKLPVAWSRITGSLGCRLGAFTFVHRQVGYGLGERQEHLALDYSHLGPHTTGNRAGWPGLWDEPAVGKQTRGQGEKPQATEPGHWEGPSPTCCHGPVPS